MAWCQILIDDPAQRDVRTFKRRVRALPIIGDFLDVDGESVRVNRVSRVARRNMTRGGSVAIVYCRPLGV